MRLLRIVRCHSVAIDATCTGASGISSDQTWMIYGVNDRSGECETARPRHQLWMPPNHRLIVVSENQPPVWRSFLRYAQRDKAHGRPAPSASAAICTVAAFAVAESGARSPPRG
jgi:hypothetical protein